MRCNKCFVPCSRLTTSPAIVIATGSAATTTKDKNATGVINAEYLSLADIHSWTVLKHHQELVAARSAPAQLPVLSSELSGL